MGRDRGIEVASDCREPSREGEPLSVIRRLGRQYSPPCASDTAPVPRTSDGCRRCDSRRSTWNLGAADHRIMRPFPGRLPATGAGRCPQISRPNLRSGQRAASVVHDRSTTTRTIRRVAVRISDGISTSARGQIVPPQEIVRMEPK
jgi:hypothetical protein